MRIVVIEMNNRKLEKERKQGKQGQTVVGDSALSRRFLRHENN